MGMRSASRLARFLLLLLIGPPSIRGTGAVICPEETRSCEAAPLSNFSIDVLSGPSLGKFPADDSADVPTLTTSPDDDGKTNDGGPDGPCRDGDSPLCALPGGDCASLAAEFGAGFEMYVAGEAQECDDAATLAVVRATLTYLRDVVAPRDLESVRNECLHRHALCAFWAAEGECAANPDYMALDCAPACRTCHLLDFRRRCPVDPDARPAFSAPGGLDAMFRRIVDGRFDRYAPVVHSGPSRAKKAGPWIVSFDDFLSAEECHRLVDLGVAAGFERSRNVAAEADFDGSHASSLSKKRTSHNTWCDEACEDDPLVRSVLDRIEAVTSVPVDHYEHLQILRYEAGEFYGRHHDFIGHQVGRPCGPRVLTFLLYLSDVEEGGETAFPDLGVAIRPRRGRALLWPSVEDGDLEREEENTDHEALKVESGIKFAANVWIHLYEYREAYERGCD